MGILPKVFMYSATIEDIQKKGDRIILKVPQTVFARRLRQGGAYMENKQYLDPGLFNRKFLDNINNLPN